MKKFVRAVPVLVGMFVGMFGGVNASAQYGAASGTGLYNPNTVVTVTGWVVAINQVLSVGVSFADVQFVLQTGNGPVTVLVSPGMALQNQGLNLQTNDPGITVIGSNIVLNGQNVILAARIAKGNQAVLLRDPASGVPY